VACCEDINKPSDFMIPGDFTQTSYQLLSKNDCYMNLATSWPVTLTGSNFKSPAPGRSGLNCRYIGLLRSQPILILSLSLVPPSSYHPAVQGDTCC
jgi:hypothetical protein